MKKEDLNLTEIEFGIFKRILSKGETALGSIIKDMGLHKGTAYNAIRRLEEKGLVSFKEIDKLNFYSVNVLSLKKMIEDEENRTKQKIGEIKSIIKSSESVQPVTEEAKIHVLVGPEGFKTFFNEMYSWAQKTKKEYLFMGKGNEMIDALGVEYYRTTQERKRKLGIKCRILLNHISRTAIVSKYVAGNAKYLKMDYLSPVSTWIYGDNVAIVLWDSKPIQTILIESKGVANSYKSFFEIMWKISVY